MKDLIASIEKAPLLPKEKVRAAVKVFNVLMEVAIRKFKKQQAEGEIAAQNSYLTE